MTGPTDRKRLGPPVDLTPEQIDQAAEPTPVDIAAARALWYRVPNPRYADLLDPAPDAPKL